MKSITKEIFKYIIVFVIIVFLSIVLLTLVASIPRKCVDKNLKQSIEYFNINNTEIRNVGNGEYSYIHTYCEEMLFNIIYCLDTDNPLESVMEAKFYERFENEGGNLKFIELVQNDMEPNAEYMRYWHGSMIFIKPLLIFLTIEQIHILNGILLSILTIIFLAILIKKRYLAIFLAFIIGAIVTACWYVPYTFEYVFIFYIMLITGIIAVIIEDKESPKKNQKLYMLFFITGILTCFFDFLTAEILTILVPLLIVLTMRMKKNQIITIKEHFIFLIKSLLIWGIGYCFMFVAKWITASLVLNINAFDYAIDKAMIRVNGQVLDYTTFELILFSLRRNFITLFFINSIKDNTLYIVSFFIIISVILIMAIDRKKKEKMNFLFLMTIIAIIPYIRYIVLANHSVRHMFMTFRCQMATIMCYILVLVYSSSKDRLFSEINKNNQKTTKNSKFYDN